MQIHINEKESCQCVLELHAQRVRKLRGLAVVSTSKKRLQEFRYQKDAKVMMDQRKNLEFFQEYLAISN